MIEHPEVIQNIKHQLPMLADDEHINQRIINEYFAMEYLFDDDTLNHVLLQATADKNHDKTVDLFNTTLYEYDPISNYSMREREISATNDCERVNNTSSVKALNSTKSSSDSVENVEQFGYNSDAPSSVQRNGVKDGETNISEGSNNVSNDVKRASHQGAQRVLERSGNIGVTTSQQMIQSERDIIIDVLTEYVNNFLECFKWEVIK